MGPDNAENQYPEDADGHRECRQEISALRDKIEKLEAAPYHSVKAAMERAEAKLAECREAWQHFVKKHKEEKSRAEALKYELDSMVKHVEDRNKQAERADALAAENADLRAQNEKLAGALKFISNLPCDCDVPSHGCASCYADEALTKPAEDKS
jgi:chromosome segregation ATPase